MWPNLRWHTTCVVWRHAHPWCRLWKTFGMLLFQAFSSSFLGYLEGGHVQVGKKWKKMEMTRDWITLESLQLLNIMLSVTEGGARKISKTLASKFRVPSLGYVVFSLIHTLVTHTVTYSYRLSYSHTVLVRFIVIWKAGVDRENWTCREVKNRDQNDKLKPD